MVRTKGWDCSMVGLRQTVIHKLCFELFPLGRGRGVHSPVPKELLTPAELSDVIIPAGVVRSPKTSKSRRFPMEQLHWRERERERES